MVTAAAGNRKQKKEKVKKKHIRKVDKPKVLEKAGHKIQKVQGRLKCVNCLLSWSVRSALGVAASRKCAGPPASPTATAPTFLASTDWKIGNTVVHSSHKLGFLREWIFCHRCAAYGTTMARNLAKPCKIGNYGAVV